MVGVNVNVLIHIMFNLYLYLYLTKTKFFLKPASKNFCDRSKMSKFPSHLGMGILGNQDNKE